VLQEEGFIAEIQEAGEGEAKFGCFLEIQGKESPTTDHRLEAG